MAKKKKKIATLDLETDPFKYGNTPFPFAAGFYDGLDFHWTWGDNCIIEMMEYLESLTDEYIIYVHNGGGFDFWYLQDYISNPLFFIKTRLAKCGLLSKHELRDSYKMIPVPLADYQKESIDYEKFWYPAREKHKREILHYLEKDCVYLFNMVIDFISRYGDHLTVGSAAIKQLKKLHPQKHESESFDSRFRPWYMGGRNECFETGYLKGNFKIHDVNSMYPYVMCNYKHPYGASFASRKTLPDNKVYFAHIKAESYGALPIAFKGLKFPHGINEFWACSHEINMGLELNVLRILKVNKCYAFNAKQDFRTFIDKFNSLKIESHQKGDKGGRLFAKLLMNSSYGKFGQNPRNFTDCEIFESLEDLKLKGYIPSLQYGDRFIGTKPATIQEWSFNNVAIASSITSAARAELMRGIAHSKRPVYCDTDSIICESLDMELHDSRLGAWAIEAEFNELYIAGKKLYACYQDGSPLLIGKPGEQKEKKACKGANLSAETIKNIALGEEVENHIEAPLLRFGQPARFISRKIRATY